jgi:NADH dehydrogenase FAD-containing subunit
MTSTTSPKRVLVLGGGSGGMYTARRLERRLPQGEAEIVLINPESYMLYTPLLPEAAAGTIEPRHVVVPLRQALRRTSVRVGDVAAVPIAGRKPGTAPPTAQHALRQARVCADNLAATLGHGQPRSFAFAGLGLLVNLSEHYGVGKVLGMPVSGLLGWLVTRTYHWFALPTWTRRLRVGLDWAVAAAFPRDVAELGTLGHPEPLPSPERRD